jgi:hypothetical protein
MTAPTLDDVIKRIRENYENQQRARRESSLRVVEAARRYEEAVAGSLLVEIARRNGIELPKRSLRKMQHSRSSPRSKRYRSYKRRSYTSLLRTRVTPT